MRARAPGRANLIGEHTDHQRGLVLPFALTLGVSVEAARRGDRRVEVAAHDMDETDAFSLDEDPGALATGGWRAYVRGTLVEADRALATLPGMRLAIRSDLPPGAGLSSSAALEAAVALAALALAGHEPDRVALAHVLRDVEARWAGVRTGLMDQLAVLLCRPGHALLVDIGTGARQQVPLGRARLAGRHTGPRRLAEGGYNARLDECAEAARLLGLPDLRDATAAGAATLPAPLNRRARHVITENGRVRAAVEALRAGDLPRLGALLDASHASLRDDFEVSSAGLEAAWHEAHAAGALGARLTGAGFGGTLIALFPGAPPPAWIPLDPGGAATVAAAP